MEVNTPLTQLPIQGSATVDRSLGTVNGVGFRTPEDEGANGASSLADTFDTFLMLLPQVYVQTLPKQSESLLRIWIILFTQEFSRASMTRSLNTDILK